MKCRVVSLWWRSLALEFFLGRERVVDECVLCPSLWVWVWVRCPWLVCWIGSCKFAGFGVAKEARERGFVVWKEGVRMWVPFFFFGGDLKPLGGPGIDVRRSVCFGEEVDGEDEVEVEGAQRE